MRKYVDPSVRVIADNKPKLAFSLWCKSRPGIVVRDYEHDCFIVGGESIPYDEYVDRILRMGLQYTLFSNFTFEIQGSILFRDILYTLNRCPQWSTSLRFWNSTLSEFKESNYKISSEYEGIPEWEEQFTKYMDKIKETMITDENRQEMPYSVSAKYWIQMPLKTIISFLSYLRMKMPFFFNVYGPLIRSALMKCVGKRFDIYDFLVDYIDASIGQYRFSKDAKENCWVMYSDRKDGFIRLRTSMGLLLYSQFIRQQDTTIVGLYDLLEHEDPEEFKHKVFYSGTLIDTICSTTEERLNRTISNRVCWFSMSSGHDMNSWSNVLNPFLKNLTVSKFIDLLPCEVKYGRIQCKYWDDVKFRLNNVEKRNLPCGIACMSQKICQERSKYDKNILSSFYCSAEQVLESKGAKPVDSPLVKDYLKRLEV